LAGLTVHNFVSPPRASFLAVALIRGFARRSAKTIGNFWVDMTRCVFYILLPISIIGALLLCCRGAAEPRRLHRGDDARRRQAGHRPRTGRLAGDHQGARHQRRRFLQRQFGASFENPTPLSNLIEMVAIFAIGVGLTNVFGRMVGNERQGWAILAAIGILFLAGVATAYWAEAAGNPQITALGVDTPPRRCRPAATWKGRKSASASPTRRCGRRSRPDTSCGAVNSMHDSYMPLGACAADQHAVGEVIVGGVGSGLYGILLFAIVALFVAGLMVGAHPRISR